MHSSLGKHLIWLIFTSIAILWWLSTLYLLSPAERRLSADGQCETASLFSVGTVRAGTGACTPVWASETDTDTEVKVRSSYGSLWSLAETMVTPECEWKGRRERVLEEDVLEMRGP
jgi:hypothetical protein